MSRRDRIDEVVSTILVPLLEKDGATIEIVGFEGSVLTLKLGGTLSGDPSAAYVKRGVIEPAIQHAAGRDVEIVYERG
ncbi:MAG: NifU family protein [Myxococcota bacterium]|nr:NifU family protein [Myxococcota bacterium]